MSSFDAQMDSDLPPVDARLVEPGTRYEMWDGELVYVPPADPPHGIQHAKISALVELHAAPDFNVACDMLTRTSKVDDVAPDVSVYPRAPHPETGGRQLEHLAFEVVSTGSLSRAGRKAHKLAVRGVRRVFAIDVERARALEWSLSLGTWSVLDSKACIEDPALAAPLPIDALVRAACVDDVVARALLIKRNPVLEEVRARARQEGRAEGILRGMAEALLATLATRGVAVDSPARARILDERDPERLDRWIARVATCTSIADVLAEP